MFTITCRDCKAELTLPARRLLVRVDARCTSSGEVLFSCLSCQATSAIELDAGGVAALVMAGVTHLTLSTPVIEHPEARPAGPPFTADDQLDLHAELADDRWFDELASRE